GATRKKHFDNLADFDLILTTYALLPKDLERLAKQPLHVLVLDGTGRQKDFANLGAYDLVLTTYALLPRDLEILQPQSWSVLIL
ncbi:MULTISPECIES: hypothetical protein, partial [unclassified Pseudomonas]|uniref:hypothetical protein n=1 Tax=unclassified Pseudomonas TaxID=196821 RepID=UPI001A9D87C5